MWAAGVFLSSCAQLSNVFSGYFVPGIMPGAVSTVLDRQTDIVLAFVEVCVYPKGVDCSSVSTFRNFQESGT